jgi:hypothetical protein
MKFSDAFEAKRIVAIDMAMRWERSAADADLDGESIVCACAWVLADLINGVRKEKPTVPVEVLVGEVVNQVLFALGAIEAAEQEGQHAESFRALPPGARPH